MGDSDGDRSTNAEREQRILDAAAGLIVHYGYDKTTVNDIAREAGVSKGSIYLHWDSKEALFDDLIWREIWDFTGAWIKQIEGDESITTFAAMYRDLLARFKDKPLLMAMFTKDKRILGTSFFVRNDNFFSMRFMVGEEFFKYMQDAGAIRQDINTRTLSYVMAMLAYGFISVDEVIPAEKAPPIDEVVEQIGELLDVLLTPKDGGNPEALRQLMSQLVVTYKQRVDEYNKQKEKGS